MSSPPRNLSRRSFYQASTPPRLARIRLVVELLRAATTTAGPYLEYNVPLFGASPLAWPLFGASPLAKEEHWFLKSE